MLKREEYKHVDLTENIISAALTVFKTLGAGFLEKVYENAVRIQLEEMGLKVDQQKKIEVFYHGKVVGTFFADLVIEGKVIVELKATEQIVPAFEAQLVNYLNSSEYEVGLLLNFGRKLTFKRKISSNRSSGEDTE